MPLKASEIAQGQAWPLVPLFGGMATGLGIFMFALASVEEMILWIVSVYAFLYLLEQTSFVKRIYRSWQAVLMMVACGQLGMCIGAALEFGSSGLLTKYALCASLPGYGIETVFKVLSLTPLTHFGMFLGCILAGLIIDPQLFQKRRKLAFLIFQSALFLLLAVMASNAMTLIRTENIWNSYFLHIAAMHVTMALCMIGTEELQGRYVRSKTIRIPNNV